MSRDDIEAWRAQARLWIIAKTRTGEKFSGNELWAKGLPRPANRRLLGSVLLKLEADGILLRAGRTPSEGGHGQGIVVWRRVPAMAQAVAA